MNGNCSDLCLLSSTNQNKYICACADNYELDNDGRTCIAKCSK
jgi:hypothetical protein